ncbi:hypothetical protein D3C87_1945370 [compost metagenome]
MALRTLVTPIDLDRVTHRLKCMKRQTNGQCKPGIQRGHCFRLVTDSGDAQQFGDIGIQKIKVFEKAQEPDVG